MNRVRDRDEMEWLSSLESDSEGRGVLGIGFGNGAVLLQSEEPLFCLQLRWGKLEHQEVDGILELFLWLSCPDLNL